MTVEKEVARLARPTHFEIASKIMKEKIFATLQETDEVHFYENGVYKPGAQFFIRKRTMQLMKNDCVRNFRTEVLDDIRVWTYHALADFDYDPLLINLRNGILDPRTGIVTEHRPEYLSLSQLDNIKYDPSAEAPTFSSVMEEILPDEYSRQRALDHFASCLIRVPLKKAFFGIGETDSAKTLFSQIVTQFLGTRNISNVALQELEDKFATYRLVGKLCNIYADVDEKAIKQTSRFKTITGADMIEVQRKGGQLFEYAPYCKNFYFGNKIPETKDLSDAFFNRWDVIKFQEKFVEDPDEKDPRQHRKRAREKILADIAVENSGILNILLPRVLEISKLGAIPNSMSSDDVRELWLYHSDYISQFLKDYTEKAPLEWVKQAELYQVYTDFCVRKKIPPRLTKTFNDKMRAFGYLDGEIHEEPEEGKKQGKHVKIWRGLKLKVR